MQPYSELSALGRARRMRQLASTALQAYGLPAARFKLLRQAGNTLFRVTAAGASPAQTDHDLFQESQYLLRIHQPDAQASEAIELELAWLAAMRRDAGLPVAEPVPAPDGRLLLPVSVPGVPGARNCSLLRWLKGRRLTRGIGADHYRAQGRLMARLHDFAAHYRIPPGLTKRHYDWAGLFRADSGTGIPASEAWALLPPHCRGPFETVTRRVRAAMRRLGQGRDAYGLIHADLGVDANLLFWHGDARAIDFDDSGFGYWVYDLAVALEHCREDSQHARYREALLEGYAEHRCLPEEQLRYFELFTAALDVYVGLWCAAAAQVYPLYRAEALRRLERVARHIARFVAG